MNENLNRDSVSDSEAWQTCYDKEQAGWERGETHPALVKWCAEGTIKPPLHVAIPGCGRGHEAIYLAEQGFTVTAIDFAEAPIEFLKYKLCKREDLEASLFIQQADVFDFVPDNPVDVVYEQTCLCAIDPQRRGEYEQAIFRWLKPGGLLLALFMQTEGMQTEGMQTGKPHDGPPFHCDLDEMRRLFTSSRWSWKTENFSRFDHPSGKISELSAVVEKQAN